MRSDDELASCVGVKLLSLLSLHVPSHYEICKLEGCLFHATVAFSPCYLSPRVDDSASLCFPSPLVMIGLGVQEQGELE